MWICGLFDLGTVVCLCLPPQRVYVGAHVRI